MNTNTMNLLFDRLNSIAHFLEKLSLIFNSDCISLSFILNRQISSQKTNIATIKSIYTAPTSALYHSSIKSLIKKFNSVPDKKPPCFTPLLRLNKVDNLSFIFILPSNLS